ncbi:transposase, partial [Bacillus amyloliquefaciens]|nr:transposase [Bacillus amyloliquefaciens]
DANGFPLMVHAFEGNKAETKTMLPTLRAFLDTHGLADVVIVADAGMVSEANMDAIEAAGLSYILGAKMPRVPYVLEQWHKNHPGQE